MIFLKILFGIIIYIALVVVCCIFFKGATRLGNAYDEKMEAERIIKELDEQAKEE